MRADIKEQWVAALRSGEYKQSAGALHRKDGGFCCLGVLCELAVEAGVIPAPTSTDSDGDTIYGIRGKDASAVVLPAPVVEWSGLTYPGGTHLRHDGRVRRLTDINDDGVPFTGIADLIEAQVPAEEVAPA